MEIESQATFKEVLQIEADLKAFEASLAQIKAAYQKFMADLGGMAGDILGVGVFAGLKQEMAANTELLRETLGVMLNFTQEFAEKKDSVEEQAEARHRQRVKESAEKDVQDAQAVLDAKKTLFEKEGNTTRNLTSGQREAEFIADEQEGIQGLRARNHMEEMEALHGKALEENRAFNENRLKQDADYNAKRVRNEQEAMDAVHTKALEENAAFDARREQQSIQYNAKRVRNDQEALDAIHGKALEENEAFDAKRLESNYNYNAKRVRNDQEALDAVHARALQENEAFDAARIKTNYDYNAKRVRNDQEALDAIHAKALEENEAFDAKRLQATHNNNAKRVRNESEAMEALHAKALVENERFNKAKEGQDDQSLMKRIRNEREAVEAAHVQALREQEERDRKQEASANQQINHIKKMAVRLLEYYAIWTLIQGAVDAIAFTLEAPFKALEAGRKYIDDIQKSADHLTGSLNANIQYSEDLVENLKLASEASKQSIMALRDVANETGLSFNHLEDTFRSLVTAGAASHVQTTRDIVALTQILNIANEQVKGDANLRGLLGDIPRLFHGTLEKGSAFLEVTHLTADEAKKLVESTKEQRDLLPILTERLKPYLSAAAQAKEHHRNIVESLEEQSRRFAAIIALPVYDRVAQVLKQMLDWADANKNKVQEIAKLFGDIVLHVEKVGEKLIGVDDGMKGVVLSFSSLVISTAHWVELLGSAAAMLLKISSMATPGAKKLDFDPDHFEKDADGNIDLRRRKADAPKQESDLEQLADLYRLMRESDKKFAEYQSKLAKLASAKYAPAGFVGPFSENDNLMYRSQPTVLDNPMVGKGEHPSMDKNPRRRFDARGEFNEEIALIKDHYEQYRDLVRDAEADLLISKREAAEKHEDIAELEIEAVEAAGSRLRKALKKYYEGQIAENKATPGDLEDALSKFDASQINAERRARDQVDKARRAGIKEGNKVEEIEIRNRLTLLKEGASQEVAIVREKYSQARITELKALDEKEEIDKSTHQAELSAIDEEVAKLAEGTDRRAQLLAQRALLEQRYLGVSAQNALQRIAIDDREIDSLRKHQLALKQAGFESETIQKQISESVKTVQAAYVDVFDIRDKDIAAKIREVQIELQLASARGKTVESTRQMREQLAGLTNERLQNLQSQIQTINGSGQSNVLKQIGTRAAIQNTRRQVILQGVDDSSPEALARFNEQLSALDAMLQSATPSIANSLQALERQIFGMDFSELQRRLNDAADSTEKFAIGLDVGLKALSNISSIVSGVQAAYDKGGILGGAGAGLKAASNGLGLLKGLGLFKGLSKSIPLVGEALGGVLEFIGPLFTKAAERIANEVKKSFQKTMNDFQAGYTTLQQTLSLLEQQRISAISQLSGKKGGQDKLDEILPQLEQQIQSLKQQQRQIIDSFEQSLAGLATQSDALQQIQSQWTSIVKTVQQYLSAGGDATSATKYLSYQLEKMQADAQSQLDDANQQAIQDAIALNDLLKQRVTLAKDFEREKFDLLNEDSLERRKAGSVTRGQRIKELEEEHQKRLGELDQQISLQTRKVEMEAKVFNLSMDISDLHRKDEELTLKALEIQIQRWTDLKSIIDSIQMQPGGIFSSNNPLLTSNPSVIVNINGDITGVSPLDPRTVGVQIGDSVREALERSFRSGSPLV
jgi:hypothetical protein